MERILLNDDSSEEAADNAMALAELCEALDEWITNVGFLPDAWKKGQR